MRQNTLLLVVAGLACVASVHALILSIDVGSDSMKIALVKPGLPFHIVSNPQSKRKTPVALTFHDGERFFGADAMGLQTRKPDATFVAVHKLLGRNETHSFALDYLDSDQYVAHGVASNARGGFDVSYPAPAPSADEDDSSSSKKFKLPNKFSVEEITAMILAHGKEFSEDVAEAKIQDAVIMVPSFYTQSERLALIDAAELAGLNVLSLVDENFAAGVRYSIDFNYNETTNVLIYNMGASQTQASIHAHSTYTLREAGTNRTFSQFKVVGKGWSTECGGAAIDSVLIEKFADAFNAGGHLKGQPEGADVRKYPKAMAKLKKTAQRVKEILSANEEYPVVVESLAADKDFKMNLKRGDVEAWAAPVLARVLDPIEQALKDASLTKADIASVEIIGGGVRMPKVQAILTEYFGAAMPLGMHLNGDEAMALGGAFVAANRSSAYRVKKIGAVDVSPFSVTVNITSQGNGDATADVQVPAADKEDNGAPVEGEEADAAATEVVTSAVKGPWFKHSQLFPAHSALGSVKKVAFRHAHDIEAVLFHDDSALHALPAGSAKVLAKYNITGVVDVVKGPKGHLGTPKIVLSFTVDHSGVYSLKSAEAQLTEMVEVPVPTPKPKPTLKSKAPKNPTSTANATETATETATASDSATETVTATPEPTPTEDVVVDDDAAAGNGTDTNSTTPAKPKTVMKKFVRKFPLKVNVDLSGLPVQPMSAKDKAASKRLLKAIQQLDDERRAREAAKNAVEAFIYKARQQLSDDAEDLEKVSKEADREALSVALEGAEEWLYDEGESTTLAVYKAKLAELKAVADVIFVPLNQYRNPTPTPTPTPANATEPAAASNSTTTGEAGGEKAGSSNTDAQDDDGDDDSSEAQSGEGAEAGSLDDDRGDEL